MKSSRDSSARAGSSRRTRPMVRRSSSSRFPGAPVPVTNWRASCQVSSSRSGGTRGRSSPRRRFQASASRSVSASLSGGTSRTSSASGSPGASCTSRSYVLVSVSPTTTTSPASMGGRTRCSAPIGFCTCSPVQSSSCRLGISHRTFLPVAADWRMSLRRSSIVPTNFVPACSSLCPARKTTQPSASRRVASSRIAERLPTPRSPTRRTERGGLRRAAASIRSTSARSAGCSIGSSGRTTAPDVTLPIPPSV